MSRSCGIAGLAGPAAVGRRRDRLVAGLCTIAVLTVGAAAALLMASGNRVGLGPTDALGAPAVPAGWIDVIVGQAVISVPPDWHVVHERDAPHGHCLDLPPRTLFVRSMPGYDYWWDCDHFSLRQVVQLAALASAQSHDIDPDGPGKTVQLGSVAAWRTPHPPSADAVAPDDGPARLPAMTSWLAPSVSLWVALPETMDAEDVLGTIRPLDRLDPHSAVLLNGHHHETGGTLTYAAIDADGRRHQWHREVTPKQFGLGDMYYVRAGWPGLTGDRFAVLEVVHPGGLRLVAGRPERSTVVWEEPAVSTDLTLGSHPQVTWSPDGTAVAWYAPREQPVMGFARWDSVDAIADGDPPVQTGTTGVAHGPVQADPPMLTWEEVEGRGWTLSMFRGIEAPYDPFEPEDVRRHRRWELLFEPEPDGNLTLPNPVRFTDLPIRAGD